jgi:hypothetical protein
MKNFAKWILVLLVVIFVISLSKRDNDEIKSYKVKTHNDSIETELGTIDYRVFYPENFEELTYVIHLSRGGSGRGNDIGKLLNYVHHLVENGYVVVQIDHLFPSSDMVDIAVSRGKEIQIMADAVSNELINYGDFKGTIDYDQQGFMGHSAGCLEGLQAVGMTMTHGDYYAPQIKAMYGMSPAGNEPDQFGVTPDGFNGIKEAAVFLVIGEMEIETNGIGRNMGEGWRLQPYAKMNTNGPRYQALIKGDNTKHSDVSQFNKSIVEYNKANSLALFDTYLKGLDRTSEIGKMALPKENVVEFSAK